MVSLTPPTWNQKWVNLGKIFLQWFAKIIRFPLTNGDGWCGFTHACDGFKAIDKTNRDDSGVGLVNLHKECFQIGIVHLIHELAMNMYRWFCWLPFWSSGSSI